MPFECCCCRCCWSLLSSLLLVLLLLVAAATSVGVVGRCCRRCCWCCCCRRCCWCSCCWSLLLQKLFDAGFWPRQRSVVLLLFLREPKSTMSYGSRCPTGAAITEQPKDDPSSQTQWQAVIATVPSRARVPLNRSTEEQTARSNCHARTPLTF